MLALQRNPPVCKLEQPVLPPRIAFSVNAFLTSSESSLCISLRLMQISPSESAGSLVVTALRREGFINRLFRHTKAEQKVILKPLPSLPFGTLTPFLPSTSSNKKKGDMSNSPVGSRWTSCFVAPGIEFLETLDRALAIREQYKTRTFPRKIRQT